MNNPLVSDKLIEEVLKLMDDGTLSDDERSIVTQAIQANTSVEENLALIEQLRAAVGNPEFRGENQAADKILIQAVIEQLEHNRGQDTLHDQARGQSTHRAGERNSDGGYPELRQDDLTGQLISSYRIVKLIGRGGMGAVYEATDELLHRKVAIKVMLRDLANRAQNRNRFLREARAVARVEHDHICPIYQVGEDRGTPFIAMPLLLGETLESRLRKRRLTSSQALDIIEQVTRGLEAAHQLGLIHRDIKPANVWLEQRKDGSERVRLLDFGLAQMESEEPGLTQPGLIMGTPSYMAPEQARGEQVDARTDLFSVGAMMYELLTGRKAFDGKTPASVLSSIQLDTPVAPERIDAGCPTCLSDLTLKLLEKDPEKRLPNAAALNNELAACRSLLTQPTLADANLHIAPPSAVTVVNLQAPTQEPAGPKTQTQSVRFSTRRRLIAACGVLGVALLSLLYFQTAAGTLKVEASDEAKILFQNGELQVLDESGKVAYRLSAKAPSETVQPGKYQVQVVGADGLTLSTEEFVIRRHEETTIRVTATSQPSLKSTTDPGSTAKHALSSFLGKAILETDFQDPRQWPIALVDNSNTVSLIEHGQLVYQQRAHDPANPYLTIPLGARLNRGALAIRCRTQHGSVFFNFGCRHSGTKSRCFSLGITNGSWNLYIQRQDKEGNAWKMLQPTQLASSEISQPGLAKEDWLDLAFRWSEKDYDVWLNSEHIAGGSLPTDELKIGQPQPVQIGMRTEADLLPKIEIASLGQWDQADVSLSEARSYRP